MSRKSTKKRQQTAARRKERWIPSGMPGTGAARLRAALAGRRLARVVNDDEVALTAEWCGDLERLESASDVILWRLERLAQRANAAHAAVLAFRNRRKAWLDFVATKIDEAKASYPEG